MSSKITVKKNGANVASLLHNQKRTYILDLKGDLTNKPLTVLKN
jgi:hypothetical protein